MADEHVQGQPQKEPRPPRKRRKRRSVLSRVMTAIGTLLLVGVITSAFLACFAAVYIKNVILPKTELDVADFPMNLSSTIYYTDTNTGEEKEYEILHGDQNRIWVKYSEIPKDLINATVAIEDRRFYQHHGVDWLSTGKSVIKMFTGGKIRGGSTITQQLIKNLTQYDDVTVKRKIQEIFTALDFEKRYSKDTILEWYLNYVYFGHKCNGVYTASYYYFGKNVSELSLAECASLISITNNPSLYDPYTNPENNHSRRNATLDWMCAEGYISEEERDAAKAEEIVFHSTDATGQTDTNYSWYTEQVITDVVNDLMEQYNYSQKVAETIVYSGGLKIYACVDTQVQAIVDEVYSDPENLPYTSKAGQQLQSAIVIVDSQGNVAALSGKVGEKTAKDTRGWNRATRTLRQPGSSIKPLAVYAPALEMGLITPYSVFEDSPYMMLGDSPWPSNVDHRYRGMMTVDMAVTESTNTVAVKVLDKVTPAVSFEYLLDTFHINPDHLVTSRVVNGKEYSDIGYSQLALGGLTDGVSTLDMAAAYSVFPRNGVYIAPRTYFRVVDSNGKELLRKDTTGEAVLKEKTVYYINEMLKHVLTSGSAVYAKFPDMTIAGKTGTTNSNNDRWFVGYTPYYTAAVWVGYDNPERITATVSPAVIMWEKVMSRAHEGLENKEFVKPDGLVWMDYCMDTGKRTTEECQNDIRGSRVAGGYVFEEDMTPDYCDAHTTVEVCTADPILKEDGTPTGRYRLAGEFCPEVTAGEDGTEPLGDDGEEMLGRISVSVLDIAREYIGEVVPEDDAYLLASLEAEGTCTVHTEEIPVEPDPYDPSQFNIIDPTTWPTKEQDPNFDPGDPTTWPTSAGHGGEEPPEETDEPPVSSYEPTLPHITMPPEPSEQTVPPFEASIPEE